jgi:hypothetical protein
VLCPHYRDRFFALFHRFVSIWLCCILSYARCCNVFVSFRPERVPNREHVDAQLSLRPRRVPYVEYITLLTVVSMSIRNPRINTGPEKRKGVSPVFEIIRHFS